MIFASVSGAANIRANAAAFVSAFAQRIDAQLFPAAARSRSQYVVTETGAAGLQFRAVTFWTAINVGLNEVDLAVAPGGQVRYTIRFPRWAGYAIGLGAALGAIFIVIFAMIDLRSYIAQHPGSAFPGLSMSQNIAIAWGMAFFWGFVWPWILIALHKRPLRRLMNRIISEVDTAALSARH